VHRFPNNAIGTLPNFLANIETPQYPLINHICHFISSVGRISYRQAHGKPEKTQEDRAQEKFKNLVCQRFKVWSQQTHESVSN
jgi:hypothetical protein